MLKTNSKVVADRIRNLIMQEEGLENFDIDTRGMKWDQVAYEIYQICMREKGGDWYCRNMTPEQRFEDWVKGLPSALDLPFIYKTSAVDVLGDILEETQEERSKFDERLAEAMLIKLIWRQINIGYRRIMEN